MRMSRSRRYPRRVVGDKAGAAVPHQSSASAAIVVRTGTPPPLIHFRNQLRKALFRLTTGAGNRLVRVLPAAVVGSGVDGQLPGVPSLTDVTPFTSGTLS